MAAIEMNAAIGEDGHNMQLQFSDLPDEIIMRILNLLPTTQDAVKTCLQVFRRTEQQHLWKSLTRLEFLVECWMDRRSYQMNLVERVMNLRDHSVPLESFSLRCYVKREDANRIEKWITQAVQSNVEHLILSLFNEYRNFRSTCLPCCVFWCQSLVNLDLQFITFDVPFSVVRLPRLKYLTLCKVRLVNDESTKKLLSSPLLEELIIDDCLWYQIDSVCVSSPSLQVLKICSGGFYGSHNHSAKICIVGDNLKYFSYTGNLKNEYLVCASSSTQLTRVEIYVDEEIIGDLGLYCYDILKGLCGTRNLALSDYFLECLQNITELLDTVPVFECLTRLDIRVYKKICIHSLALMKVYERCPHLEYLNIGKLSQSVRSLRLSHVPLCFHTHLKKILVHFYVYGDDEADAAIAVLLKSAIVLEELVIYCNCDKDKGFHEGGPKIQELHDRFNRRPRASKDCIISIKVKYAKSYLRWDGHDYYYEDCHDYDDCYLKSMNES